MSIKIGFIGAGNMAGALFRGMLAAGLVDAQDVWISDVIKPLTASLQVELGLHVAQSNVELVGQVDLVVLAIKPIFCPGVLREIHPVIGGKAVCSIVSGLTMGKMAEVLPGDTTAIRVMPNMPAMVGGGMTLLCREHTLVPHMYDFVERLFQAVGECVLLEERLFDAATAISGCGPAYLFECIEAMADAGVMHGVPRALCYRLAAQTLVGAGQMVLKTGTHPGTLKDAVCSPGGTTIRGIYALEKAGMRAAMMGAVDAAFEANAAQSK